MRTIGVACSAPSHPPLSDIAFPPPTLSRGKAKKWREFSIPFPPQKERGESEDREPRRAAPAAASGVDPRENRFPGSSDP
jgi:hypothetical protein